MLAQDLPKEFKCTVCGNLLSIFPVNSSGDKYWCGRCTPNNIHHFLREVDYEKLTRNVPFQCKNMKCIESYEPDKLAKHEIDCEYQYIKCNEYLQHFGFGIRGCAWRGLRHKFYEHCKLDHTQIVLRNNEKRLVCGEYYFLRVDRLPFIMRLVFSNRVIKFVVTSYNHANEYSYELTFEFLNNRKLVTPITKVASTNNDMSFIQRDQGWDIEPNADVKFTIILTKNAPTYKCLSKSEKDVLSNFECPVCMFYMVPPIKYCDTGHGICSDCKPKCNRCPICQAPFGKARNVLLEKIADSINFPCKYRNNSCRYTGPGQSMRNHQNFCKYGPYSCPIQSCSWKDKYDLLLDHIRTDHADNFLLKNSVQTKCDGNVSATYLATYGGDIFKLYFKYDTSNFYWTLQLIGQAEEAAKYSFQLDLGDNFNTTRLIIKKQCGSLTAFEDAFTEGKQKITLPKNMVEDILVSNELTFKFQIMLNRKDESSPSL